MECHSLTEPHDRALSGVVQGRAREKEKKSQAKSGRLEIKSLDQRAKAEQNDPMELGARNNQAKPVGTRMMAEPEGT